MQIIKADLDHLEILVPLFDAYRVFYQQPSDLARARNFLQTRLTQQDSMIFLTLDNASTGAGFVQIYPTFSSIRTATVWILNDLYVAPEYRSRGIAKALMNYAKEEAVKMGIAKITLSTAHINTSAQQLYEALAYQKDEQFLTYHLIL